MKVQISLDDELVARIDNCADSSYTTRSGFITQACVQYLNQTELVSSINRISFACQRIAESNTIDEETKRQFEEFQIMVRVLTGQKR